MRCAECSTPNPLDHKFCKECGVRLDDGYRTLLRQARAAEVPAEDAKAERLTQLLDMAFWHNEAGHLDAAVKACEAALSLHADNTTAHSLLGTLYEKKGDDATAIQHFQQVVTLNPDSVADAQKLDQLTRGVHVRAAAPPAVHKWIPPALASLTLLPSPFPKGEGPGEGVRRLPRWVPLAGGSVAAALVLGIGLNMMGGPHPPTPSPASGGGGAENVVLPSPVPTGEGRPSEGGVRAVLVPGAGRSAVSRITLTPGAPNGTALADLIPPPPYAQAPVKVSADPFAGHVPAYGPPRPQFWGSQKGNGSLFHPPSLGGRGGHASGGSAIRALPPLSLKAVPLPGDGLSPAPVDVPADASPAVPQHTVVVRSLGGQSDAPPASTSSPHIHISVNSGGNSDGPIVLTNVPGAGSSAPAPDAGADAARLQQSALSAQQSGAYKEARSWYQQAIRAYRAQIAAGRDVDTARAGLTACQTGLAICQQQPL